MKTSLLTAVAVAFALAFAGTGMAQERSGIDPVLRGTWRLHAMSTNKGRTMRTMDGDPFAVVSANKIRFLDGDSFTIKEVRVFTDAKGNAGNRVLLSNGELLEITKEPGQRFVLVKVFKMDDDDLIETGRFVITVDR